MARFTVLVTDRGGAVFKGTLPEGLFLEEQTDGYEVLADSGRELADAVYMLFAQGYGPYKVEDITAFKQRLVRFYVAEHDELHVRRSRDELTAYPE